jgi:hypothetical protein
MVVVMDILGRVWLHYLGFAGIFAQLLRSYFLCPDRGGAGQEKTS